MGQVIALLHKLMGTKICYSGMSMEDKRKEVLRYCAPGVENFRQFMATLSLPGSVIGHWPSSKLQGYAGPALTLPKWDIQTLSAYISCPVQTNARGLLW